MILDTCALLWLAEGGQRLSQKTRNRLNEAPVVYLSAISGFEIALKSGKGSLKLPKAPAEWLEQVIEHHHLTVLDLNLETCVAAAQLPPIHQDPCDRFIIAGAKSLNVPVVTSDERFEAYGVEIIN